MTAVLGMLATFLNVHTREKNIKNLRKRKKTSNAYFGLKFYFV